MMRLLFLLLLFLLDFSYATRLTPEENDQRLQSCGRNMRLKIFNGANTNHNVAPYALHIHNPRYGHCSGALISTRHILTAAHCFLKPEPNDEIILESGDRINGYQVLSNGSRIGVINRVIVLYGSVSSQYSQYLHDVAIIELARDVHLSSTLNFPCLTEISLEQNSNKVLHLFGFGANPMSHESGFKRSGVLRKELTTIRNQTGNHLFTARNSKNFSIACAGDSGGPAVQRQNSRIKVVGVLVRSFCNETVFRVPNTYELYENVFFYSDIICSYTGICSRNRRG